MEKVFHCACRNSCKQENNNKSGANERFFRRGVQQISWQEIQNCWRFGMTRRMGVGGLQWSLLVTILAPRAVTGQRCSQTERYYEPSRNKRHFHCFCSSHVALLGSCTVVCQCRTHEFIPHRSRFLLQKLTVDQLVKKLPTFCGNRNFNAVYTTAHLWVLSWDRWTESMP
jgi:hypothetical protein